VSQARELAAVTASERQRGLATDGALTERLLHLILDLPQPLEEGIEPRHDQMLQPQPDHVNVCL
jgi:hypothetical protein